MASGLFVRRLLEAHLLEAERRIQEAIKVMDSNSSATSHLRVQLTRVKLDLRDVLEEIEGDASLKA